MADPGEFYLEVVGPWHHYGGPRTGDAGRGIALPEGRQAQLGEQHVSAAVGCIYSVHAREQGIRT